MKTHLSSVVFFLIIFLIGCEQDNSQEIPLPPPVFSFAIFQGDQNLFPSNTSKEQGLDSVKVLTESRNQIPLEISSTIQELGGYGFFSSELLNNGTYFIQISEREIDTLTVNINTFIFNGNEIEEQLVGFYILRK